MRFSALFSRRQTQNREGTETVLIGRFISQVQVNQTESEDGNFITSNQIGIGVFQVDQTQGPERGRKHFERRLMQSPHRSSRYEAEGDEHINGWRCVVRASVVRLKTERRKPTVA